MRGGDGDAAQERRANRALVAGAGSLAVGAAVLAARDWRPPAAPERAVEQRMAAGVWAHCRRVVTERLQGTPAVRFPWLDERAVVAAP